MVFCALQNSKKQATFNQHSGDDRKQHALPGIVNVKRKLAPRPQVDMIAAVKRFYERKFTMEPTAHASVLAYCLIGEADDTLGNAEDLL